MRFLSKKFLTTLKSRRQQRPVRDLPLPVLLLLLSALMLQMLIQPFKAAPTANANGLPIAPSAIQLSMLSLGDSITLSKSLMLWLQTFDNQAGISIAFNELNYTTLVVWLTRILALDPQSQYPLLAASRLYAQVPNAQKQRQMMDFIETAFHQDPHLRWPWLAHGVLLAKHRLGNLKLALKYARLLADMEGDIPAWAQQMEIFILEDMGELESARILIGGLIQNGRVKDKHELHFLQQKLQAMEQNQVQKP